MSLSTQQIKGAVKEALAEQNEAGIQPIIIPPLAEQFNGVNTRVLTQDVVDSLLRHKQYKGVKDGTVKTYKKHLYRFARQFPALPLETTTLMDYLDRSNGKTGRYKRNQHDLLSMLYEHASSFFWNSRESF